MLKEMTLHWTAVTDHPNISVLQQCKLFHEVQMEYQSDQIQELITENQTPL